MTVIDHEQLVADLARLDELERALRGHSGAAPVAALALLPIIRIAVELVASEGCLPSSLCTAVVRWRKSHV